MIKTRIRTVGQTIPTIIFVILATSQLIFYLAIISFESASLYYDAGRGTIYAGYWCSLSFFITWIGLLSFLCCRHSSICGIYLVVQNFISAIFAIILIAFTARFIQNPCVCYGILCKIPTWDSISTIQHGISYDCTSRTIGKLSVLKALLTFAILMLVSNLIFIVVYIIGYISLRRQSIKPVKQVQSTEIYVYESPSTIVSHNEYQPQVLTSKPSDIEYYDAIAENKQLPTQIRAVRF